MIICTERLLVYIATPPTLLPVHVHFTILHTHTHTHTNTHARVCMHTHTHTHTHTSLLLQVVFHCILNVLRKKSKVLFFKTFLVCYFFIYTCPPPPSPLPTPTHTRLHARAHTHTLSPLSLAFFISIYTHAIYKWHFYFVIVMSPCCIMLKYHKLH